MPYICILAGIAVGFFALQSALLDNANSLSVKSIPTVLLTAGLLFCLITYLGVFGAHSESVIAENQAFAKFLAIHLALGLAGCMAEIVFTITKRQKF